jgi:hypothetical protein
VSAKRNTELSLVVLGGLMAEGVINSIKEDRHISLMSTSFQADTVACEIGTKNVRLSPQRGVMFSLTDTLVRAHQAAHETKQPGYSIDALVNRTTTVLIYFTPIFRPGMMCDPLLPVQSRPGFQKKN